MGNGDGKVIIHDLAVDDLIVDDAIVDDAIVDDAIDDDAIVDDLINLLESPQPCPSSAPMLRSGYPPSISGTKCSIIDPLVSKRPEKF